VQGGGIGSSLIFLVFMFVIFYFLLIRPQKKRVNQHRALIESVGVGDEIVTIGGLYGTVRNMGEEDFELEVSPGTTLRFTRSAIARRVTEDLDPEETPEPAASAGDTGEPTS